MSPEQKNTIKEIVQLFDEAESRVKEVELLAHELSIPSVNQLRYVGYHLARSLNEEDNSTEFDLQIGKAKGHCQRAIYDAHEAGIIFMLERVKQFREVYSGSPGSVL
jgi:hypothetical protein